AVHELRAVGAGIWMPSNAMQVFGRLNIAHKIEQAGAQLTSIQLQDCQHGTLTKTDLTNISQKFGYATTAIHRGRLQALLVDELDPQHLHLNKRCTHLTQHPDHVEINFTDGTSVSAAIVIGADGLNSAVRQQLFPTAKTRYSGQSSFRAVVPVMLNDTFANQGIEIWGHGCRFGFSTVSDTETYWYATFDIAEKTTLSSETSKTLLKTFAKDFPHPILALVQATPTDKLIRADIHDLATLPKWHTDRVVLIGDAAHATTPNLGQGGAQSVEDAYVLATALAEQPNPQHAFQQYENTRRAKALSIVNQSWQLGKLAHLHNPAIRWLRDTTLKLTPAKLGQRQFESIYSLNF
ncbi:MAG: FAD-dependent monooxygenase, partial [Candidatus Promineifilaceae bacterium]